MAEAVARYRKRPVMVEAIRYTGTNRQDVDLVRRIVETDKKALDLLDEALRQPVGTNQHTPAPNIIRSHRDKRQAGTSKEYALRRLRKDAPDLHSKVVAGNLSPHAAMVDAGLARPRFTVVVTTPEKVAKVLRNRLPAEMLPKVARILAEDE